MRCKYWKRCIDYDEHSIICREEGGSWTWEKKANCYLDMEKKENEIRKNK